MKLQNVTTALLLLSIGAGAGIYAASSFKPLVDRPINASPNPSKQDDSSNEGDRLVEPLSIVEPGNAVDRKFARSNLEGAESGCVVRVNQPNDSDPGSGVSIRNSSRQGVGSSHTDINVSISRQRGTIAVDTDECVILKGDNLKEANLSEDGIDF